MAKRERFSFGDNNQQQRIGDLHQRRNRDCGIPGRWSEKGGNGFSYIRLHKSPNPDVSDTGDAATYAWGGKWRRPTHDEMQYLKTNCTWAWTGSGYTVSKSGKSIFLPVKMESSGAWGAAYYWTQTTANSITSYALHLDSSSKTIEVTNVSGSDREDLFIRPVLAQ